MMTILHLTTNGSEEFCDRLKHIKDTLYWSCASRVESLNEKILSMMRKSGCYQIGIGLESGSENVLKWLDKKTTPQILEDGIRRIHSAGG